MKSIKKSKLLGSTTSNGQFELSDDSSDDDSDILPGDLCAATKIIRLKNQLKTAIDIRKKTQASKKEAIAKLTKSNADKCAVLDRRLTEATRRYETDHFSLSL